MVTEYTRSPDESQRSTPSSPTGEPAGARTLQREPRRHVRRSMLSDRTTQIRVQQALGWLSVGLGVTALLAPRSVGALTGVGPRQALLRMVGARELISGAGLLAARDGTPWLWSRVVGDAMDLLVLGTGAARPRNLHRTRAYVSMGVVAGIAAADVAASLQRTRSSAAGAADRYLERSIIISKDPQACYEYWRNLSNVPSFMAMIESVTDFGDGRSHWVAALPGGKRVEWDARITDDRPGERIAWHSTSQSPFTHAGVVRFERAPGDRGTLVRLIVHYAPPGWRAGRYAAQALDFGPDLEMAQDLRRFKQILECGEIPTTRGQPSGRRSMIARAVRAGRFA